MQRKIAWVLGILSFLVAIPSRADVFAIEVDAQAGYSQINGITRPDSDQTGDLKDFAAGVRGKIEILMISAFLDYQHLFSGADYLFVGPGIDFKLPTPLLKPFIRGTIGLMMLAADGKAFDPDASQDLAAEAGFQIRVGAGLEIPLGDWFALGVAGDAGFHYITGAKGFDYSVMGFLGLRI